MHVSYGSIGTDVAGTVFYLCMLQFLQFLQNKASEAQLHSFLKPKQNCQNLSSEILCDKITVY